MSRSFWFGFSLILLSFNEPLFALPNCGQVINQQDTVICPGSSMVLTLAVASPVSVAWSTGETTSSIQVAPSSTTTYTVTVDDGVQICTEDIEVTVAPEWSEQVEDFICQGDSYTLPDGSSVTTSGTYVSNLSTLIGCDSIITTELSVFPNYNSVVNASICAGETYQLPGGQQVATAGTYPVTLTTINGCDSVITTNLTIKSVYSVARSSSICSGETFTLPNGTTVTSTGVYPVVLTAVNGCDSTVTTTLTVKPVYSVSRSESICNGETFTLPNGTVVASTGVYPVVLTAANGCDSTVTTTLTVKPVYSVSRSASICNGETFVLPNGTSVAASGVYPVVLTAANGCDSTVTTTLTVKPVYSVSRSASICNGETFVLPNGTSVAASGVYPVVLTAANGCDSTVTTTLTVKPVYSVSRSASICNGESFVLPNGTTVTSAGVYPVILTASNGCDSTVTTTLTIRPVYSVSRSESICNGESFILPNGTTVASSGVYPVVLTAANGCDSTVTTTLTVKPIYSVSRSTSICNGETFTLPNGTIVTSAGVYPVVLTASNGCDSTVTTTLTVRPVYSVSRSASICNGESFILPNGTSVTSPGVYPVVLTANNGCDSTVTTTLTVKPVYSVSRAEAICQGDEFILPDGQTAIASGVYPVTLTTVLGCDSIITTTLTVHPVYNISRNVSICQGESHRLPNGQNVTAAGTYTVTLSTTEGCDSVIVTTLSVRPTYTINRSAAICNGDSYTLPNGQTVSTAGVYPVTLLTVTGCDSVVRTTLSILPVYSINRSAAICQGDSYTLPNGQRVFSAGNYSVTFSTVRGCDSIINTQVTVYPVYSVTRNVSICQGSSYTLPNGNVVMSPGTYVSQLQTTRGCDSVITVMLTVGQVISNTINASICQGESYQLPTGQQVTAAGTYVSNFLTSTGCDSTITTILDVNQNYSYTLQASICQGEVHYLPDGMPVSSAGVYPVTLISSGGCDSSITTDLTVFPSFSFNESVVICQGVSHLLPDGRTVDLPGTYISVFSTSNGCDSLIVTSVSVIPPPTFSVSVDLCRGEIYYLPDGQIVDTSGVFQSLLDNSNGCDSLVFTFITLAGFDADEIQGDDVVVQWQTANYSVTNASGHFFQWTVNGGNIISGQGTHQIAVQWSSTGTGTVVLQENDLQCFYSDTMNVSIGSVGFSAEPEKGEITAFPNPFNGLLNVSWPESRDVRMVRLIDFSGRVVKEAVADNVKSLVMETGELSPGYYLLIVEGDETGTLRLIKQ